MCLQIACVFVSLALASVPIHATESDDQEYDFSSALQVAPSSCLSHPGASCPLAANIWQWRKDMNLSMQTTCDLNPTSQDCTLFWSCNEGQRVYEAVKNGTTFVAYHGRTGVSVFNKRLDRNRGSCLMRKSRVPIDLSKIGRIEMDVKTSGSAAKAPWYAVWLAPMLYSFESGAISGEINLIENHDGEDGVQEYNNVHSSFPSCNNPGESTPEYTKGYCKPLEWGVPPALVDHHITLTARDEGTEGRVIEVRHCRNSRLPMHTCRAADFAQIKVTKPNPAAPAAWMPVWNKTAAGNRYGHYWLVTDIWYTSNTDFQHTTSNVRFFTNDGAEWRMPVAGHAW